MPGHVSIEETAVALEALAVFDGVQPAPELQKILTDGAAALLTLTENGGRFEPSPIGLYFARLWYYERLYPVIFTAAALRAVLERLPRP